MARRKLWLKGLLAGAFVLAMAHFTVTWAFPNPAPLWLGIKDTDLIFDQVGSDSEAINYYSSIGAPGTFDEWKDLYGFDGVSETSAIYYNAGDLGFGREMHCRKIIRQNNAFLYEIACYVVNHGLGPGAPARHSLDAAIAGQATLPTVAMVYSNDLYWSSSPHAVQFYIYAPGGARLNGVPLDGQGTKYLPHLCLACHGGGYDPAGGFVNDANFLPFDADSFQYSHQAGYTRFDQRDKIRRLNALVRETNPALLIGELIDGWYAPLGVNSPASTFNGQYVAYDYDDNGTDEALYNNVVKPYCRSCHIAQGFNLQFPSHVGSASSAVFSNLYMPHAELANHNFWGSPAPITLANNRGWSLRVTKTDDSDDGACDSDCSLREAVVEANGRNSPAIVTFEVDGTFTLELGELAISNNNGQNVFVLGNGADRTIIDAGGNSRVMSVGGPPVIIHGVTIRGGNVPGQGAGILNDGGTLILNFSAVRDNTATFNTFSGGAGIAAYNNAQVFVNQSTIGPGNDTSGGAAFGGGIYLNSSALTLHDSTVTGNSADVGGGLFGDVSSVMTLTHATVTNNLGNFGTGGLFSDQGTITHYGNSIIGGNIGGGLLDDADCGSDNAASNTSVGYNLLGENGSGNGCSLGANDNAISGGIGAVIAISPGGDHRGVPYHPLVSGSPAIDAIPIGSACAPPSYDLRNLARPQDGDDDSTPGCDIGAHEVAEPPPPPPMFRLMLPVVVRAP